MDRTQPDPELRPAGSAQLLSPTQLILCLMAAAVFVGLWGCGFTESEIGVIQLGLETSQSEAPKLLSPPASSNTPGRAAAAANSSPLSSTNKARTSVTRQAPDHSIAPGPQPKLPRGLSQSSEAGISILHCSLEPGRNLSLELDALLPPYPDSNPVFLSFDFLGTVGGEAPGLRIQLGEGGSELNYYDLNLAATQWTISKVGDQTTGVQPGPETSSDASTETNANTELPPATAPLTLKPHKGGAYSRSPIMYQTWTRFRLRLDDLQTGIHGIRFVVRLRAGSIHEWALRNLRYESED